MPRVKSNHSTDVRIGARERTQRLLKSMSQQRLGNALGVTFQQVQKYEKGVNRISAGRLEQIAKLFGVPVSFYFADEKGSAMPTLSEFEAKALRELRRIKGNKQTKALAMIRL